MIIYYAALAIFILGAIAITIYLWMNQRRLDRQGEQIKKNARDDFERAAVQAARQGLYAEAKLARVLKEIWN